MTHHSDTDVFDDLRHIAGLALSRAGKTGPVREGLQRRIDRLEAWLREPSKQHGELLTDLENAVATEPVVAEALRLARMLTPTDFDDGVARDFFAAACSALERAARERSLFVPKSPSDECPYCRYRPATFKEGQCQQCGEPSK